MWKFVFRDFMNSQFILFKYCTWLGIMRRQAASLLSLQREMPHETFNIDTEEGRKIGGWKTKSKVTTSGITLQGPSDWEGFGYFWIRLCIRVYSSKNIFHSLMANALYSTKTFNLSPQSDKLIAPLISRN